MLDDSLSIFGAVTVRVPICGVRLWAACSGDMAGSQGGTSPPWFVQVAVCHALSGLPVFGREGAVATCECWLGDNAGKSAVSHDATTVVATTLVMQKGDCGYWNVQTRRGDHLFCRQGEGEGVTERALKLEVQGLLAKAGCLQVQRVALYARAHAT